MKKEIVITKAIPNTEQWIALGKPRMFLKIKKLLKGVLYSDVVSGKLLFITDEGKRHKGNLLVIGDTLIVGTNYTGGEIRIFKIR